ncbi:MAG: hypothetical protein M3214_01545 [Actinomycetota bacterium]|nr:hypothetical protein [Actinomycetota bacterium]
MTHGDDRLRAALQEIGDAYVASYSRPSSTAAAGVRNVQRRQRVLRFSALGAAAAVVIGSIFVGARVLPQRDAGPAPLQKDETPTPSATSQPEAIAVGDAPVSLAVTDDGSLWVGHENENTVMKVGSSLDEPAVPLDTRFAPTLLATDGRTVFYGNPEINEVSQIEPDPTTAAGYGNPATDMVVAEGRLLFSSGPGMGTGCGEGSCVHSIGLSESGMTSGDVVISVGCCPISALAVGDGHLWAASGDDLGAGIVRQSLDGPPDLLEAPRVGLPEAPTDLLLDGNTLWAALPKSKVVVRITRIDTKEWHVQTIPTDVGVSRLAVGENYVFGAGPDGSVVKVLRNGVGLCSVVADLGGRLGDIVVADDRLYVAVTSNDTVVRLDEPK